MISEPTTITEIQVSHQDQTTPNLITTSITATIKFINGKYTETTLRGAWGGCYVHKLQPSFLRELADVIEKVQQHKNDKTN